jgi:EAL domain-containing protein (putative c-di-GMP-specific phosphodiesterase class I)
MRDEAGDLVPLGALLRAAQRYNLIPSIDGWVTQRALQLLAPYAAMLRSRGIEFLLPLASQSFADAAFVGRLSELLRDARLPQGCITLLFSEQAATESLVHARALTRRMKKHGCRYALDDFSMGKDSVLQIQNLEITRLRASVTAGAAAIRSIVEFGRMVSAETLVTGVDSESLSVSLQRSGIDYLQGTAIGGCELLEDLLHDLTSDESRRQERLRLELG